jgi:hypothetical protein
MDSIVKYVKYGRLLEIGPWRGAFCCNATDAGFNVTAIEMDQSCVNFLQKVLGIKAIRSDKPDEALDAISEKFDVIGLWHSLEHLPKPWLGNGPNNVRGDDARPYEQDYQQACIACASCFQDSDPISSGVVGLLLYQSAKSKYKEKYAGGGLTMIFTKTS